MFWEELNDARRVEIEPRASEVEVEEFHASGICGEDFWREMFFGGRNVRMWRGVAGGRGRGDRRREAEYDAIMMCSPLVMITAEPDYRLIIPTVIFFDN